MPSEVSPSPAISQRIFGAADIAERIRAFAWETTSLGPHQHVELHTSRQREHDARHAVPHHDAVGAGDGVP